MVGKEIVSHTRDIYCRLFKDKIIYRIPCYFAEEHSFGSSIEVEVALLPKEPLKKFVLEDMKKPLSLTCSASKDNYTTTISVEQLR